MDWRGLLSISAWVALYFGVDQWNNVGCSLSHTHTHRACIGGSVFGSGFWVDGWQRHGFKPPWWRPSLSISLSSYESRLHGGDVANWHGFDVVDVGLMLQLW